MGMPEEIDLDPHAPCRERLARAEEAAAAHEARLGEWDDDRARLEAQLAEVERERQEIAQASADATRRYLRAERERAAERAAVAGLKAERNAAMHQLGFDHSIHAAEAARVVREERDRAQRELADHVAAFNVDDQAVHQAVDRLIRERDAAVKRAEAADREREEIRAKLVSLTYIHDENIALRERVAGLERGLITAVNTLGMIEHGPAQMARLYAERIEQREVLTAILDECKAALAAPGPGPTP